MEGSGGRKEVRCLFNFRFFSDFIFVLPAANAAGFLDFLNSAYGRKTLPAEFPGIKKKRQKEQEKDFLLCVFCLAVFDIQFLV